MQAWCYSDTGPRRSSARGTGIMETRGELKTIPLKDPVTGPRQISVFEPMLDRKIIKKAVFHGTVPHTAKHQRNMGGRSQLIQQRSRSRYLDPRRSTAPKGPSCISGKSCTEFVFGGMMEPRGSMLQCIV